MDHANTSFKKYFHKDFFSVIIVNKFLAMHAKYNAQNCLLHSREEGS